VRDAGWVMTESGIRRAWDWEHWRRRHVERMHVSHPVLFRCRRFMVRVWQGVKRRVVLALGGSRAP
jgi:hypothetical protein